jgi:hypothetical protein
MDIVRDVCHVKYIFSIQCCSELTIPAISGITTDYLKLQPVGFSLSNHIKTQSCFEGKTTFFWNMPPLAEFFMSFIKPFFWQILTCPLKTGHIVKKGLE